ncbi:MAG: hypothetical protein WC602_06930, partial [archaeon]
AATTYQSGGDLHGLVRNMVLKLVWISLPFFIVTVLFAPPIFSFVFGADWREAGVYTQLLSLWFFGNFLTSPISDIPLIVNRQKTFFLIGIVHNFLIIASIFFGGYFFHNIKLAFCFLSGTIFIWLIFQIWWFLKISKQNDRDTTR